MSNYSLRYAKAQEFYGYETPAAVLVAVADFDNNHNNTVLVVNLHWRDESRYGATVLWEDC